MDEIIEVAGNDTELWVSMIAETMKTLPATGSLNTEISEYEETRPIFTDMVNDLKKLVTKHSDLGMLPLECQYLNKPALVLMVGQQPAPVKHFTLKRKPKSAALRAELLQKSCDAQSHLKKSSAPTIPLRSRGMPRKMTDTTPLKGIPSRVPTGGFLRSPPSSQGSTRPNMSRTPAGRKDGGIKLLEITEQPLGYAAAKKRKRQQDLEEQQKRALEAQVSVPTTTATTPTTPTTTTPDYAAGLTATSVYTQPATPAPATIKEPPSTPIPAATTVLTHTTSTPTPIPSSPVIPNTISGTTTIIRQTSIGQNPGNTFTLQSPTSEPVITATPKTPQKPIIISQQTLVPATEMKTVMTSSSNSPIVIKTENKQPIGLQTVITSTHNNLMNSPVTITQRQLPQQIQQHHILQQSPQHHQQQQQTKIVQIKTTPTLPMMMATSSANSIQNMPPLISTQQPTIVNLQNMNMQGRKTVTISVSCFFSIQIGIK